MRSFIRKRGVNIYKNLNNFMFKIKNSNKVFFNKKKNYLSLVKLLKKNNIPITMFIRLSKKRKLFLRKLVNLFLIHKKYSLISEDIKVFEIKKKYKKSINTKVKKKILKKKFFILKKKLKIKNQLSLLYKTSNVELKMNNFLKSKKTSRRFKLIYTRVKKKLLRHKLNFFNKQFKEVYAAMSLGIFFFKARSVVQIFSQVLGYVRFRYMRKTMHYMFNLLSMIGKSYSVGRRIRLNIYGKFKGKAQRTQLKYIKTRGVWGAKTLDENLTDFHVGYVGTSTGVFGIKLWIN